MSVISVFKFAHFYLLERQRGRKGGREEDESEEEGPGEAEMSSSAVSLPKCLGSWDWVRPNLGV